jgi:O-antigen/teichoic acid export membrane protein
VTFRDDPQPGVGQEQRVVDRRRVHQLIDAVAAVAADPVLRRRLQRGFVWNILATAFNQGSTFLLSLVAANLLGRERFGAYALIQSTLLLVGSVAQLAMGFTTTKYVAELRSSAPERAARIVAMCATIATLAGLAGAAIAWIFAPEIAALVGQPSIAPLIRLGAPIIFFISLSSVCTGALAGFERFRAIAIVGAAGGTIYLAAGALGAIRWGLPGVIGGVAVAWAVQTALLAAAAWRAASRQSVVVGRRAFREMVAEHRVLLHFALPAALTGFTITPTVWIVNAVLARQPGGIAEVAIFSASNSLRILVILVPALLNGVGVALLNDAYGRGDETAYRRIFFVNVAAVTTTALVAMAVLMAGAPWALRAFGKGFVEGRGALIVLLASAPVEALWSAAFLVLQTHGRMWAVFLRISLPRDGSIVASTFLLVPRYGALGAGLAFLIGASVALFGVVVSTRPIAIRR